MFFGGHSYVDIRVDIRVDMCGDMCVDMCVNMLLDVCVDVWAVPRQLCLAIEALHRVLYVYRDLKFENIMLCPDGYAVANVMLCL